MEQRVGRDVRLYDIGSGIGLFPAACARLGMRVTMMDDFQHPFAEDGSAQVFADAPDSVNYELAAMVFGKGKWSQTAHWYETERFHGHVREPDVDDLRYIARDLDLSDVELMGRNWAGYLSASR